MLKKIVCVLAVAAAVSPTVSLAQFQGTPQEQAACRPDVIKHCKEMLGGNGGPDTFRILACLQSARSVGKLSKPCGEVLKSHGQ